MGPKCRTLLDAALELSEAERAVIAEALIETLSPENAELLDDELAAELDSRLEEFRKDSSSAVSWSELGDER
jgi:putative addiction module component (TIGR02574 family)